VTARDDLLAALTAERYDNRWWSTDTARARRAEPVDDELTTARRRRLLADEYGAMQHDHEHQSEVSHP